MCLVDADAWQTPRHLGASEPNVGSDSASDPSHGFPSPPRDDSGEGQQDLTHGIRQGVVGRSALWLAEALDAALSGVYHSPIMSGSIAHQAG